MQTQHKPTNQTNKQTNKYIHSLKNTQVPSWFGGWDCTWVRNLNHYLAHYYVIIQFHWGLILEPPPLSSHWPHRLTHLLTHYVCVCMRHKFIEREREREREGEHERHCPALASFAAQKRQPLPPPQPPHSFIQQGNKEGGALPCVILARFVLLRVCVCVCFLFLPNVLFGSFYHSKRTWYHSLSILLQPLLLFSYN